MEVTILEPRTAEKSPGRFAQIVGNMPASYFGIVLGLAGLGNAWRAAGRTWQLPASVSEWIYVLAGVVWATLVVMYLLKAILAPAKLWEEAAHPVQCCFIGLAGVATMLIAGGLTPYSHAAAYIVLAFGFVFTVVFAVWRTGGLWQGERDHTTTTAVLYLPTVAGSFVSAIIISALGYPDWGQFAFGAGMFSWLAIESVLLNRLLTGPTKAIALRPTLGIQLAPAPVGALAYIAIGGGAPDVFVHALIGYGVLQLLVLTRLSHWIAKAGAVPGLWALSFGMTAIAAAPTRLIAHGDSGAVTFLAPVLFVMANVVVAGLSVMTIILLMSNKMFTSPQPTSSRPPA